MPIPMQIKGDWDDGYVIDYHTVSSTFIGEDTHGHPIFDTVYTELGKLLHNMKYNGHIDNSEQIVAFCLTFVNEWVSNKDIDLIMPIPSTVARNVQPVNMIAQAFSKHCNISYIDDVLMKRQSEMSKNMDRLNKNIDATMTRMASNQHNVLLIDDIYDTGTTANACVQALRTDPNICNIYFLALTRRRR